MAYDRWFNNTMAIFTAFGGGIDMDVPELNWSRVGASHFGLPGDGVWIHQNGVVTIAISFSRYYADKSDWTSTFNPVTNQWEANNYQQDSRRGLFFGGYGLFLAHQWSTSPSQNTPYDYRSTDGINWTLFGYNSWGSTALATNGTTAVGTIWHTGVPYAYSPDVYSYRTMKICEIPKAFSQSIICNRKIYVLQNYNTSSLYTSYDGGLTFVETIKYPHGCDASTYTKGIDTLCVCNEHIFVTTYKREAKDELLECAFGVLNANGTEYSEIATHCYDTPYIDVQGGSVIYIDSIGKYIAFCKSAYVSSDCIHWEERPDLVPAGEEAYFAWYVKGKGIYCQIGSSPNVKMYFAPLSN